MADNDAREDAPVSSPSIALLTLARRIESELAGALPEVGLTVSRLGLLGHISGIPGASLSDLARLSGVTVQSVHAAVRVLTASGLVRDGSAQGRSPSAIELTDEGRRVLGEAMRIVGEVDAQLFGPDADPVQRHVGQAVREALEASR